MHHRHGHRGKCAVACIFRAREHNDATNQIQILVYPLCQMDGAGDGATRRLSVAVTVIVVWAGTGPVFGFSDTWQLVINGRRFLSGEGWHSSDNAVRF